MEAQEEVTQDMSDTETPVENTVEDFTVKEVFDGYEPTEEDGLKALRSSLAIYFDYHNTSFQTLMQESSSGDGNSKALAGAVSIFYIDGWQNVCTTKLNTNRLLVGWTTLRGKMPSLSCGPSLKPSRCGAKYSVT